MATTFRTDEPLTALGRELTSLYHSHLTNYGVRVDFLMRSDTPKVGGKEKWGEAVKVTGRNAFLATDMDLQECAAFFCVVISEPIWDDLSGYQRRALVDHELAHCWCEENDDGEVKLSILPHDLEEFRAIVDRYGLWREDVRHMAESFRPHCGQLALRLEDGGQPQPARSHSRELTEAVRDLTSESRDRINRKLAAG
jgi:hypothetical protein